jgi:hypothetical protein
MVPQRREQAYQTLMEGALSKQAARGGAPTQARRPSPAQGKGGGWDLFTGEGLPCLSFQAIACSKGDRVGL